MGDGVRFTGGYGIEFNGRFFEGDAAIKLRNNIGDSVRRLAEYGQKEVVRQINARPASSDPRHAKPGRGQTGFTAQHVEVKQDPPGASFYAKVRMEDKLMRPGAKATRNYRAENIAYIVAWVMESGRRYGFHTNTHKVDLWTGRSRSRRIWQHGRRYQKPLFAWRRTATLMRRNAKQVTEDLAKGLD